MKKQKNRRSALKFIVLTVLLVVFLFWFGIPFFTKIIGLLLGLHPSSDTGLSDNTPPPPPIINDLPDYTKESKIQVSGSAEAGSSVTIYVNSSKKEILTGADGTFSSLFSLRDGTNSIYAVSKDNAGNISAESEKANITLDQKPPTLEVTSPSDGQSFYGSKQKDVQIEGQTEPDASVTINDRIVVVDNNGKFSYKITQNDGQNTFDVVSKDKADNETKVTLTTTYSN